MVMESANGARVAICQKRAMIFVHFDELFFFDKNRLTKFDIYGIMFHVEHKFPQIH